MNPPSHGSMGGNFHTHDWDSRVEVVDLESEARESTRAARRGEVGGIRVVRMLEMGKQHAKTGKASVGAMAAPVPVAAAGVQRQREPRENAEFLRICVLEMNMRRAGKLEADVVPSAGGGGGPMVARTGRRAFWLPPRQMGRDGGEGRRWVAVCA